MRSNPHAISYHGSVGPVRRGLYADFLADCAIGSQPAVAQPDAAEMADVKSGTYLSRLIEMNIVGKAHIIRQHPADGSQQ
jgi:hypothetical protein